MLWLKKITAFFLLNLFCIAYSFAQDSVVAVQKWNVESKKTGDGKYELIFSAPIKENWQVYAPNQTLLDTKTTELKFADSAIVQEGNFILEGKPKEISSVIFEKNVSVYETVAQWKATIKINGTAPAKLQGTLLPMAGMMNFIHQQKFLL